MMLNKLKQGSYRHISAGIIMREIREINRVYSTIFFILRAFSVVLNFSVCFVLRSRR